MEKNFEEIMEKIDLSQAPPTDDETARQYYFMKKAREYVKKQSEELGRPLFAVVKTFGCQMNFKTMIAQTA